MRLLLFLSALLLTASTAVSVTAADLTKIDQTIRKEPSYQGKPRYCLFVWVGTPGLGKGPFAARYLEAVKPPVVAVADIAFPAEDGGMPPIVTKATIKECCCGFVEGSVRVPGKAGKGLAKVTVHIPDW